MLSSRLQVATKYRGGFKNIQRRPLPCWTKVPTWAFTFKLQNLCRQLRHPLLTLSKQPQNCAATSSVVVGAVVAGVVADVVAWSDARVSVRRPPPDLCRLRQQRRTHRRHTGQYSQVVLHLLWYTRGYFGYSDTFFLSDRKQRIINEGSRIPGILLLNKQVDGWPDIGFMILTDSPWASLRNGWSSVFLSELWQPSWRCTGQWRVTRLALAFLNSYIDTVIDDSEHLSAISAS